jgi:short-subunit dehydrogenase
LRGFYPNLMVSDQAKKVVLITGASSGIGLAVASHLATKNYIVYGTYRSRQPEQPFPFHWMELDVHSEEMIHEVVAHIIQKEGRIDVLINNAGLGTVGSLEDTTLEESRSVFETNVFGVHAMCRAVLPHMRKQQAGTILNITSIAGIVALPYRGVYNSTKFAVEGFSEALSMEVKPFGINVIILRPGDYKTNITSNRAIARNAMDPSSVYYDSFQRAHFQIKEEVNTAWTPNKIAVDIARILKKKRPRLHYISAPLIQKFSITAHRYLPSRLFENMVSRFYKV